MNGISACLTHFFFCIQHCFDSACFLSLRNTDPGAGTLTAAQLLFSPGVEKPQLHHTVLSGHLSTSLLNCCGVLRSLDKTTVLRGGGKRKEKKNKKGEKLYISFSLFASVFSTLFSIMAGFYKGKEKKEQGISFFPPILLSGKLKPCVPTNNHGGQEGW